MVRNKEVRVAQLTMRLDRLNMNPGVNSNIIRKVNSQLRKLQAGQ